MPSTRQQKRLEAQRRIISHFEEKIPYFTDIFDERTFYISFACLVIVCAIVAVILSVCCNVTIKDADDLARQREERKRLKQQKQAEKLLRKKLAKAGLDPNFEPKELEKLKAILEKIKQNQKGDSDLDLVEEEEVKDQ